MEASLSLQQIQEFAKKMTVDVPFTAIDVDDNVLLFLFMTDSVEKVEMLKNSRRITTEIAYKRELDAFVIFVLPMIEEVKNYSPEEYQKYAACGLVRVDDAKALDTLKAVSEYRATAQFYTFDKELKSISIKPIFNNEFAITLIRREINKMENK